MVSLSPAADCAPGLNVDMPAACPPVLTGQPGEQWTMFFHDPSGNALEFKAMSNQDNLFAKYRVD